MLMPKPHTSNDLHIKSFSAHVKKKKEKLDFKESEKTLRSREDSSCQLQKRRHSTASRQFLKLFLNFHAGKLANKYRVLKY